MFKIKIHFDEAKLRSKVKNGVKEQMTPLAGLVLADFRSVTPVDSGEARDSWAIEYGKENFTVTNSAEHIVYLNAGTSAQAPSYFIETTALKYGKAQGQIVKQN